MIEGARWRKWVFFYVPMTLFLLFLLFPFYWMVITSVRPDGELYRPWNSVNYNPFWTWNPTWDHVRYLFEQTLFASWLWNTTFIALVSTAISLVCGVFAGYALLATELSICRQPGHRHLHHLSGAPDTAVHSAGRDHPQLSAG